MADRHKKARLRRIAILTLLLVLLATALGTEIFPNKGHAPSKDGTAAAGAGSGMVGGTVLALLPLDRGAFHPGVKHKAARLHTANGDADSDVDIEGGFEGGDGLQTLVYRSPAGDDNKPESDGGGGDGWGFGGGGGHGGGSGGGGGGGGSPFGFSPPGGNDPGADNLPLAFSPPSGPDIDNGGKSGNGRDDPPFPPPNLPSTLPGIAAVPEPTTWVMFILGFGFTGALLRRARDAALTPARNKRLG